MFSPFFQKQDFFNNLWWEAYIIKVIVYFHYLIYYSTKLTNASTGIVLHDTNLPKQEKSVVELLSQGYSSKQIAGHLKTIKNTVDNQRKHMLKKTNT